MSEGRSFAERNARSQNRLQELIARLSPEELLSPLPNGWTAAATLAHLAFWDRWSLARWDVYDETGEIPHLPDETMHLVNAAAAADWLALPAAAAVDLVLGAAAEIDARIEALPAAAVADAIGSGRPTLVDRSLHRDAHLAEIAAALSTP